MLTPQSMPQSLESDVIAAFNLGREESAPRFDNWGVVTKVISSRNETEEMDAIDVVPSWRRWRDERQSRGFDEYPYRIHNYPWEHTISIDKRLIMFEKTGQIERRAKSGGAAFERWLSETIWSTMRAGSSLVCYDGQYYFDTDHAWSGSNQSNLSSGNSPLAALPLEDIMEAMLNFKDSTGKNLGVRPDLIITGPQNDKQAWELTKSAYTTETTSFKGNYFEGMQSLTVPWISGNSTQNEFYVVDSKMVDGRPVVHTRVTENPILQSREDDSDAGFNRREWRYGGYYDGGFGVGDWYVAYKNGTADPALADIIDPNDYYAG